MLDFAAARARVWRAQERLKCFPDVDVVVAAGPSLFFFNMATLEPPDREIREPYLMCFLRADRLEQIFRRELHWNSAEIGCLIAFDRRPNIYAPDVHTLMSFFHP